MKLKSHGDHIFNVNELISRIMEYVKSQNIQSYVLIEPSSREYNTFYEVYGGISLKYANIKPLYSIYYRAIKILMESRKSDELLFIPLGSEAPYPTCIFKTSDFYFRTIAAICVEGKAAAAWDADETYERQYAFEFVWDWG